MPRITGANIVDRRLKGLGRDAIIEVGKALYVGGDAIRVEAALSLTRGSVSGRFHVPSAPRSPPNEDTGFLRAGLIVEQVAPLRVNVVNDIPYAADLEFGTSKMIERPFMAPAARAKKKEVVDGVRAAVSRVTRRKK